MPQILLGTCILCILLGVITLGGSKLLLDGSSFSPIKVALTGDTTGKYENFGISILENMDSTESTCEFIRMEEEEAKRALENEEIAAIVHLPSDFVRSIMNGTNTPATLTFAGTTKGLGTTYLRLLTDAGVSMLSSAQSSVYSAEDFYKKYADKESSDEAVKQLNIQYITKILSRSNVFTEKQVSVTNGFTVAVYYAGAAILIFILMSGMTFTSFLKNTTTSFEKQLRFRCISNPYQLFTKLVALFMIMLLHFLFLFTVIGILLKSQNITLEGIQITHLTDCLRFIVYMCPALLFLAILLIFLMELAPDAVSGTLLLFLFTFIAGFVSGCFLPTEFLPQALRHVAELLPTTHAQQYICHALTGKFSIELFIKILIASIVLYGGTLGIRTYKQQH